MIARFFITVVAVLHFNFLLLEMFLWNKPLGLSIFRMSQQKADDSKALAANQGLYNGFLCAGLFWADFSSGEMFSQLAVFFLSCVVIAGAYGAYSVSRRIFWIQSLPALLGLGCLYLKI